MRNWFTFVAFVAFCAVATPATAQGNSISQTLDAVTSAQTTVADLIEAVKDCRGETQTPLATTASELESRGWVKLSNKPVNFERSLPASRGIGYVRRNILLTITQHAGTNACRILAFLDVNADHSSLNTGLQQDMGFSAVTRLSKFALRNPTVSDDKLSQFYETKEHLVRVKFEPESDALGVNIIIAPNL
ncbi:MAG: hypothetical protein ACK5NN_12380 [Sphingomonadaceae bacterium]